MNTYIIGEPLHIELEKALSGDVKIIAPYYLEDDTCEFISLQKIRYGRQLRRSETGCTLAHHEIWKSIVSSQNKAALVLENDAFPIFDDDKDLRQIHNLISEVKQPMIIVVGLSKFSPKWNWWLNLKHSPSIKNYDFVKLRSMETLNNFGTVSYLINNVAAENLLNADIPWIMADDFDAMRNLGLEILFAQKFLFKEQNNISATQNENILLHNVITRPKVEVSEFIYLTLKRLYKKIK